jgi:UDP-glucose 4-epimerase
MASGERVVVTGIAGSLARLTALELQRRGYDVVGVDYRRAPADHPECIPYTQANYNKTRIEDVIRRHRPRGILHLGRVGNLKVGVSKRFDLNVVGSGKIFELSLKYDVERVLVLSTFHIYGAHPSNHIPIAEDEPIRAGTDFPELADAVQLDNLALQWSYRHRQLKTIVLRPCNVVGPDIQNAISKYLRQHRQAAVMGFDPMWQFIHQTDMVEAIIAGYESPAVGVYNVAGMGTMPFQTALKLSGGSIYRIPSPLARAILAVGGRLVPTLPPYLIDFCQYPVVISDAKFRADVGFQPRIGLVESITSATGAPQSPSSHP